MQFLVGRLPPLRPVPEPRVTTAVFVAFANLSTPATSAVERVNTTHAGICCNAAVPSKEYGIRSSLAVRTLADPSSRPKSLRNCSNGDVILGLCKHGPEHARGQER